MRRARIEVFRGKNGLWYWRLRSSNGKIQADGSEGYASRRNAFRAASRIPAVAATARIVVLQAA